MGERNSQIILAKGITLDRDYRNVMCISNSAMIDKLLSDEHRVATATDYSFIRNNGRIRTTFTYSQCLHANYIAFQNMDYDNKWFFAWIDNIVYRSDFCTEIEYTVDSFTTWYDNWSRKPCIVTREKISNDYIGASRTSENFSVENYICRDSYEIDVSPSNIAALFTEARESDGSYVSPYEAYSDAGIYTMDGLPMTLWRVGGELKHATYAEIMSYYGNYVTDGKADSLVGVFLYPDIKKDVNFVIASKLESIDGYTPVNKKCLQYPFVKIVVTNNQGASVELRQEDFSDSVMTLRYSTLGNYRGQAMCYPYNYKGVVENTNYSLVIDNYPTIPMTKDNFSTWLAQNSTNVMLSAVSSGIAGVSTAVTGNPLGAVMGLSSLANTLGSIYSASIVPDSVSGQASGDLINNKLGLFKYNIQIYTAPVDVIKAADDFFSRYGYSSGLYKIPKLSGFVQISADSVIGTGDVPAKDMNIINNAFRKGCFCN